MMRKSFGKATGRRILHGLLLALALCAPGAGAGAASGPYTLQQLTLIPGSNPDSLIYQGDLAYAASAGGLTVYLNEGSGLLTPLGTCAIASGMAHQRLLFVQRGQLCLLSRHTGPVASGMDWELIRFDTSQPRLPRIASRTPLPLPKGSAVYGDERLAIITDTIHFYDFSGEVPSFVQALESTQRRFHDAVVNGDTLYTVERMPEPPPNEDCYDDPECNEPDDPWQIVSSFSMSSGAQLGQFPRQIGEGGSLTLAGDYVILHTSYNGEYWLGIHGPTPLPDGLYEHIWRDSELSSVASLGNLLLAKYDDTLSVYDLSDAEHPIVELDRAFDGMLWYSLPGNAVGLADGNGILLFSPQETPLKWRRAVQAAPLAIDVQGTRLIAQGQGSPVSLRIDQPAKPIALNTLDHSAWASTVLGDRMFSIDYSTRFGRTYLSQTRIKGDGSFELLGELRLGSGWNPPHQLAAWSDRIFVLRGSSPAELIVCDTDDADDMEVLTTRTVPAATALENAGNVAYLACGAEGVRAYRYASSTLSERATLPIEALDLSIAGTRMAVLGSTQLSLVDIANSASPTVLATLPIAPVTAEDASVCFSGEFIYLRTAAGITIVDARNPAQLQRAGEVPGVIYGDGDAAHPESTRPTGAMTAAGDYLYLASQFGMAILRLQPDGNVEVPRTTRDLPLDRLAPGAMVYSDREYSFVQVPENLAGAPYFQLPNADKSLAAGYAWSFEVAGQTTVYVAHDSRFAAPPQWLADWEPQAEGLTTSERNADRRLYARTFPAGVVTLGPNSDDGNPAGHSMYSVILKDNSAEAGAGWNRYR